MKTNQLIFLISQPRSGSSLIQQLLLNSNQLVSHPEPWQMLSLIHTYKETPLTSGYNPNYTNINYISYLNSVDNGLQDFKNRIQQIALEFYEKKMSNEQYFLDKTPRYYHVIEELYELFPNAKFVFLVRSPLAVFSSILDYNFKGDYVKFLSSNDRLDDLFLAPKTIHNAITKHANCILIKYEDLIVNSEKETSKIFNYLSIKTPENNASYSINKNFVGTNSVDTKSLQKHNAPNPNYLDAWKTSINTSQKKKLAKEYLQKLQDLQINNFSYDLGKIIETVNTHKPYKNSIFNIEFDLLSKREAQLSLKEVIKKRVFIKLQKI